MPGMPASHISGVEGKVLIPDPLDAYIGTISTWKLDTRRSDDGSATGLYDLSAVLSWIHLPLWEDQSYEKVVEVSLGRGSLRYRLEQTQPAVLDWSRRSLKIEGVRLCRTK